MINTIIAKTQTSKKAIDFRDGLVLAYEKDYAMLHGAGGKKYAPVSVINLWLTDYSAGKGDKSVTVNANLDLEHISMLHAKAQQFLLNSMTINSGAQASSDEVCTVNLSRDAWAEVVSSLAMVREASKANSPIAGDQLTKLGKALKTVYTDGKAFIEAQQKAKEAQAGASGEDPTAGFVSDFKWTQVKVNSYRMGQDGLPSNYAPVTKLTITHSQKDRMGNVIRSPWYISITNGTAATRVNDIGAVTYDSSTFKVKATAFMNVSDLDMFRMMEDCKRYIDAFTLCFGLPLVKRGVTQRIQEREDRKAEQAYNRT